MHPLWEASVAITADFVATMGDRTRGLRPDRRAAVDGQADGRNRRRKKSARPSGGALTPREDLANFCLLGRPAESHSRPSLNMRPWRNWQTR